MRLLFSVALFLAVMCYFGTAQTKVDGVQVKNLVVSPIASIERSKCVGSGVTWNCAGLQLIRLTLVDGTKIGPYVLVPATSEVSAIANWESISLNHQ